MKKLICVLFIMVLVLVPTVAFADTYTDDELNSCAQEIWKEYGEEYIYSVGIGWTNEGKGFGESGKESRVIVGVPAEHFDKLSAEIAEKYGEIAYVQVEEQASVSWNGGVDEPEDTFATGEEESPKEDPGLGPIAIVLIVIGCAAILFRRLRNDR